MWHRLGLLCPWLIAGSFAFALAMGSEIARPSTAEALSESYCGRIVPSGGVCGSNMGYQYWRYNRASYTGGGSIYQICGLLRTEEGRLRSDPDRCRYQATYAYTCSLSDWPATFAYVTQYELTGASHTIYGNADNSTGHGCS